MLQVQGCYGLQYTKKDSAEVLSSSSGLKTPEKKSQAAASKHALAESYRRKRINNHLNTLRKLFPNLPKSDKPRVLMETVRCLKELRKKVADHVEMNKDDQEGCCIGGKGSCSLMFLPSEKDEVSVSYYSEGGGGDLDVDQGKLMMVKATICCEDRLRLNADLTEAVKSVKGRVVKAEMGTIGGRTKAVLVVQWCKQSLQVGGSGGGGGEEEEEVRSLRKALNAVVDNRALTSSSLLGPEAAYFQLDW